jgi:CelD/BcsL family acetyltransferase involved in cellulose biosynthesis
MRFLRALPIRALRVLGDCCTGSEYPDWIVSRGVADGVADLIAETVARDGTWDLLWMPSMAGWTGASGRVAASLERAGLLVARRSVSFGAVSLPGEGESCLESLPRNRRSRLRSRSRRILAREGAGIAPRRGEAGDAPLVEELFRLHRLSRTRRGDPGTFVRRPSEAAFYRRFAPEAFRNGWLRIHVLSEGGECKAVQYGYLYGGCYLQLQEGYDPSYEPGAGNVLRLRSMEMLAGEGAACYDFLGTMSEHKRRWGCNERFGMDLLAGRPTPGNRLLFAGRVWPTGRFLRPAGPVPE